MPVPVIEQIKVPTFCLHFHHSGNIQEKVKKDGNALDDYAGAATGASILREKSDRGKVKVAKDTFFCFNLWSKC